MGRMKSNYTWVASFNLMKALITIQFLCFLPYLIISNRLLLEDSSYEMQFIRPKVVWSSSAQSAEQTCLSPERKARWALDGSCMEHPHTSAYSSTGFPRSCGLCGEGAAYLRELRDTIAVQYKNNCQDIVVYGAALGSNYATWMQSRHFLGIHSAMVVRRHGTCFFQFVTNSTGEPFSIDGSQNLIEIDTAKMPYENNRRNTKILKMNPGLLFPWAKKVIWQDAKLLNDQKRFGLPSDYLLHFNRTVGRFGTCVSFMGLPHDLATVGNSSNVSLRAHCDTIIAAAVKRPTVSDNLDVLHSQCKRYEEKQADLSSQFSRFHQDPLIDSAFIVYNMQSPECRKFNGDLGCSWLDEIHCYSDRDQISFPHVIYTSGLTLSPELDVPGQEYRDRVYIDKNNISMLHIGKRSCHWYYGSFSRCMSFEGESLQRGAVMKQPTTGLRVAIIVAGMLQRLMFASTMQYLIKPMTTSKIPRVSVDYFASLSTGSAKAYRSASGYADHLQRDPVIQDSNLDDAADIEEYIRREIIENLASVGALTFPEIVDIDSEPILSERRRKAIEEHPFEDPDTRFPLFDIRNSDVAFRTANANRNLLRMHFAIKSLWEKALRLEREEGFKYDYVIFLRDDSLWLKEFNIQYIESLEGDIFVPTCDARDPAMEPSEINDHILIARRHVADIFGNYYNTMFNIDMKACMARLPEKIQQEKKRGCNSEMVLKWLVDKKEIAVTRLGQKDVPFQRSANVRLKNGTNLQCFHKFCQSRKRPLEFSGTMQKIHTCKSISWDTLL